MSYTDMNPSPPQDTTFSVPENRTLSSDDNNNNALLRGDNHTDCDRLRHIIKEPGPNNNSHNTRETNTLTDGINLTCNVHSSQGHGGGILRNSGITYTACRANRHHGMCLWDRGANGVICGDDVRVISMSDNTLNVTGIDNHEMRDLRIGTFGGVVSTQMGDVIAIFNQCAYHPTGRSIISCIQVEDNGICIDDRSISRGGKQCIATPEGYIIPLDCIQGLMYVKIRPYTDEEANQLPSVILTRDVPWNPSRHDGMLSNNNQWRSRQAQVTQGLHDGFDTAGNHTDGTILDEADDTSIHVLASNLQPSILSQTRHHVVLASDLNNTSENNTYDITMNDPNYEAERIYFLNVPQDVVRRTRNATTNFYQSVGANGRITNHYRSPYPAANASRRHEQVATDSIYTDTAAFAGGATCAQVFVGRTSRYIEIYGMHSDAEFVNTLNDEIRDRGAMDMLTNDRAQAEISKRVKDILRSYVIKDWQSEPHQQHQNYSERIYQDVKKNTNWVLNWSGAPPQTWLWAFQYCAYIMNRTARQTLGWRTPYEALYGQTPDISVMLKFVFWELCYIANYQEDGGSFPSESNEIAVRMIGFSESVGHSVTFKVFNEATNTVLFRSGVRKITRGSDVNNRINPAPPPPPGPSPMSSANDATFPEVVRSAHDDRPSSSGFDPSSLIGRHFLTNEENGERIKGSIVDYVGNFEDRLEGDKVRVKFKVKVGKKVFEQLVDYQAICDFIEDETMNPDGSYNMEKIIGHRTTGRKNKIVQLLVEWKSGECTYEPISKIYQGDRFMVAEYARDHGLLEEWDAPRRKLIKAASQLDTLVRFSSNVMRIRCNRAQTTYQYGHVVPSNHNDAMRLDRINDNDRWSKSEKTEVDQLMEYEAFIDYGHRDSNVPPQGYQRITLHCVYAVKHDERYKSRMVAGGHLTGTPTESVYSGVVSLRGVRIVIFLAELNGLKIWQTDVGNAYLEATTEEKVYVIAGPEFGEKEGHIFVINKALYGLKTSGKRWHERFSDVLREMGFIPCKAEPDIWMRDMGDHYEYIAVYTDDLTIASRDPEAITNALIHDHKFKLKGTGALNFLLGSDYTRDDDGTLCMSAKKYTTKMKDTYVRLFGKNPTEAQSPLEPNCNPELDTTDLLEGDEIKIFQTLVGQASWVIQLGRFDIGVHVMTLSSFRVSPRKGHLECMKRIYGYCWKFKNATIRVRTGMPDFSDLKVAKVDWSKTPYAGAREDRPRNLPVARGKPVQLYTYADANLGHNKLNGKSVTAILHFMNGTPYDWFSKLQSVVNTATYGSESTAARTAIEQMRTNKMTLQYLGVPIVGPSILFGDNKTVVDSSSLPQSKLHKRHLMLSYHYVREALATGEYVYSFVNGKINPSDILSKHWAHKDVWPLLNTLLFWKGDTLNLHRSMNNEEE